MPSKKKKYNARFPAGRIKKIMQSDEEIGKVAQAVPIIISRTLELFVESMLTKTLKITNSRNAKTLSPSHMKQCIMSENRFDFLRELVKNVPDISVAEEVGIESSSPGTPSSDNEQPFDLSMPSTSNYAPRTTTNRNSTETTDTNGSNLLFNNGIEISVASTNVPTLPQVDPIDCRAELKRSWNAVNKIRMEFKNSSEITITPTSPSAMSASMMLKNISLNHQPDGSPPIKLHRTDSAPSASSASSSFFSSQSHGVIVKNTQTPQSTATTPTPTRTKSNRRLQHQAKSVPCSSKDFQSSTSSPPSSPAPIFSIDFGSKPIVKIDYSNLALHDSKYSAAAAAAAGQTNFTKSSNATVSLPPPPTPTTEMNLNPVINIDLSHICTNPLIAPAIACNPIKTPSAAALAKSSSLELDEDYDDI